MKGHIRPYIDPKTGKEVPDVFHLVVPVGKYANGRAKYKWRTFHGKKRDAENRLAELVSKVSAVTFTEPTKMTVEEFGQLWMEKFKTTKRKGKLPAKKSIKWYIDNLENHINPAMGKLKLVKVRPLHIQETLNGLESQHVAAGVFRTLRAMFNKAVLWWYIPKDDNPITGVESPTVEETEYRILTAEEAIHLLDVAKKRSERFLVYAGLRKRKVKYRSSGSPKAIIFKREIKSKAPYCHYGGYVAVLLALTTGMRLNEIVGLQWQNVDLKREIIRVYIQLDQSGKNTSFKNLKTQRSRRLIPIVPIDDRLNLIKELEFLQKLQAKDKEDCGGVKGIDKNGQYEDYDLVFTIAGGRPLDPHHLSQREFKYYLREAGLPPIKFHLLRHSVATLLKTKGVDTRTIADILGHAEESTPDKVYIHSEQNIEAKRKGLQKMSDELSKKHKKTPAV